MVKFQMANLALRYLSVVAGSNELSTDGDSYETESIRSHVDYDSWNIKNDIAVVKLKTPIIFSDKVKAIDLKTEYWVGNIPDNLQHINLKSVTSEDCAQRLNDNTVDRTHVCTLTKADESACHRDCGSALVTNKQIGIVSFGRPCVQGYPDIYTRVSSFKDWIAQNRH
ncbi:hypothetical protein RI129_007793 [Pyrocoelia pectoralis]|uniref:Peptidase S1 domain-containing protein n=1 Tax=Pyrocoelia pectoralis TaxID=417401 RepID=A0AAN7VBT6_9COLE